MDKPTAIGISYSDNNTYNDNTLHIFNEVVQDAYDVVVLYFVAALFSIDAIITVE